jgi:hypothetical protein
MGSAFADRGATKSYRVLSAAASDNAAVAFDSPSSLRHIIGNNARAGAVYLRIYALKSTLAVPTSVDTPAMTIYLPASSAFAIDLGDGFECNFGIGIRMTTGSADNDASALTAGDILGLNLLAA